MGQLQRACDYAPTRRVQKLDAVRQSNITGKAENYETVR